MKPDFLIIPYEIKMHPDLRPTDSDVYAVVYWFEKMKDGKCTASNETIAEVAVVEARSVRASLDRLERAGYIERIYADKKRKIRMEIKTMVHFTKANPKIKSEGIKSNYMGVPILNPADSPNFTIVKQVSPGEFARKFFDRDPETLKIITTEMLLKSHGRGEEILERELNKFIAYWTEPTKSGRKQLWETKPTFEVRRRLSTWFNNIRERATARHAGAGVTV